MKRLIYFSRLTIKIFSLLKLFYFTKTWIPPVIDHAQKVLAIMYKITHKAFGSLRSFPALFNCQGFYNVVYKGFAPR